MNVSKAKSAALAVVIALPLFGCSSPTVDVGELNPYQAEFDGFLAESSSEFVSSVLGDYEITTAEFSESKSSFVDCLEDGGLNPFVSDDEDGIPKISIPSNQADGETYKDCEAKWDGGIMQIYRQQKTNPDNIPWFDLMADCLVHGGFTPSGLTGKELEEIFLQASTKYVSSGDGGPDIPVEEPTNPDPVLPGGHKLYSEETADCINYPYRMLEVAK